MPCDWGSYYQNCGDCGTRYHASEGGCDCGDDSDKSAIRTWLRDSGFEYHANVQQWCRRVQGRKLRVCRRDHADGTIKKGQSYWESKIKWICDITGKSEVHTRKVREFK